MRPGHHGDVGHLTDQHLPHRGFWPLTPSSARDELGRAVNTPPDDASVAATYLLVPHLTHRRNIYSFPNPWQPQNWGVNNERRTTPPTWTGW